MIVTMVVFLPFVFSKFIFKTHSVTLCGESGTTPPLAEKYTIFNSHQTRPKRCVQLLFHSSTSSLPGTRPSSKLPVCVRRLWTPSEAASYRCVRRLWTPSEAASYRGVCRLWTPSEAASYQDVCRLWTPRPSSKLASVQLWTPRPCKQQATGVFAGCEHLVKQQATGVCLGCELLVKQQATGVCAGCELLVKQQAIWVCAQVVNS